MKVDRKKLPKTFESFELSIIIETEQEETVLKKLFGSVTAHGLVELVKKNTNYTISTEVTNAFLNKVYNSLK